uniref:Uncharacterized protein n=1 Tax=Triticum urartu TaxID=4572 RepID=A0A8R7QVC0_TRIUA
MLTHACRQPPPCSSCLRLQGDELVKLLNGSDVPHTRFQCRIAGRAIITYVMNCYYKPSRGGGEDGAQWWRSWPCSRYYGCHLASLPHRCFCQQRRLFAVD